MPLESLQNGRYQITRELGSGSMGEVFLVNDTVIGRQVAIKMMRADPAAYPDAQSVRDAVRLFKREAQAIARLEHPRILPLFDFGEEKGEKTVFTYMVMPHCQEGSLADWLQHNRPGQPLPLAEVASFIEQAAEALQYAHEHGVIHQDVKPSNFLLRVHGSGQVLPDLLLADFGIARMSGGTTVTTVTTISASPRGTPRYMPPEQWEGKPVPASDQYALAVMAYQLLTLRYPFAGDQMLQLMYQHLQNVPEPPGHWNPALPRALDAVILRALAKKPAERFPSITAFASALRQTLPADGPAFANPPAGPLSIEHMPTDTAYNTSTPTLPPRAQPLPAHQSFSTLTAPTDVEQPGYAPARPVVPPPQRPLVLSAPALVASPQSWVTPAPAFVPAQPVQTRRRGKTALLVCLILLIVLAGGGGASYYFVFQPKNVNHIQTPPPVNKNANPYTSSMPMLSFADPLSKPAMWQSLPNDQLTDGYCLFQQGAYHASANKTAVYTLCPAASQQSVTSDMTFEVRMQILHGDCGGFLFRGDFQQGDFYYFDVCFDGRHYLATYHHFALVQQLPAHASMLPALQADAQATVTVGVVAQGSSLTFFLNGQEVDRATDSTYSSGQIALLCFAINNPTEVVFSDARLWTA